MIFFVSSVIMDIKEYMQTVGRRGGAVPHAGWPPPPPPRRTRRCCISPTPSATKRPRRATANAEIWPPPVPVWSGDADRLTLSEKGVHSMAEGVEQVAKLPDPIGEMGDFKFRPSASRSARCARRSASSASSTKPARTSPPTPAALCLNPATPSCAAARRRSAPPAPSPRRLQEGLKAAGLPAECVQVIDTTTAPPSEN